MTFVFWWWVKGNVILLQLSNPAENCFTSETSDTYTSCTILNSSRHRSMIEKDRAKVRSVFWSIRSIDCVVFYKLYCIGDYCKVKKLIFSSTANEWKVHVMRALALPKFKQTDSGYWAKYLWIWKFESIFPINSFFVNRMRADRGTVIERWTIRLEGLGLYFERMDTCEWQEDR